MLQNWSIDIYTLLFLILMLSMGFHLFSFFLQLGQFSSKILSYTKHHWPDTIWNVTSEGWHLKTLTTIWAEHSKSSVSMLNTVTGSTNTHVCTPWWFKHNWGLTWLIMTLTSSGNNNESWLKKKITSLHLILSMQ